ncbi:MAG TPA: response regulator transcription factor [Actinocatenispora sp.]
MADRVIRVLLVDDEELVCAYLGTILGSADDIEVVATATDGAAAIDAVARHRPHVVLMDLRMPGMDGLTAIGHIAARPDAPAVVALTTFDTDAYVTRALRAGAAGFLLKSTPPEDLIGLVRVAADGHTVLSPAATRRLLAAAPRYDDGRDAAAERVRGLTDRERDVLACLGEGLSNARVARRLHLSEATVKGYVSRLMVKLDCANRTQVGLLAREAGLTR